MVVWVDLIGLVSCLNIINASNLTRLEANLIEFLLDQLPKPITYHENKFQYRNSKLCGSNCLYLFYLIERMNYYDTTLKICF